MQTELKALIVSMTAERDKLSGAIAALRTMQTGGASTVSDRPQAAKKVKRERAMLSSDVKAQIVAGMQNRPVGVDLKTTAKRLSRQFGATASTIYMGWRVWQKNGNVATKPVSVPTTEANQPSA